MEKMQTHPFPNECPWYNKKQFEGDTSVLKFSGMQNTLSLPSLPGQLWPGVIAPDRVLSMDQIELFEIWTVTK